MKIHVIFTGGTIGSRANDGWISPSGEAKRELIRHYEALHGKEVEFTVSEPYCILSESLSSRELDLLVESVIARSKEDPDGIIITHGTDTLQYSAAALSFAMGDNCIPILMVSANYPLNDSRSNGHENFRAAVEFIRQKAGKGVYVVYKNSGSPTRIHKGHRLLCHGESDDAVYSINNDYYGEFTAENSISIRAQNTKSIKKTGGFTLCDPPKILVISMLPGASYDHSPENCDAVILRPYHSGTLDTSNKSFTAFCEKAAERGTPIFLSNARSEDRYATDRLFDSLNIIPIYDSTFICVYMRLWIALSREEDPISVLTDMSDL